MLLFRIRTLSFTLVLCLSFAARAAAGNTGETIEFNRDVRPIITENCFACHGPDKNQRKAKLRLDVREVALEKGAIVPGKPDKSELVRRIFTDDADDHMPPLKTHKVLSPQQKDVLRKWVAAGAVYEPHWAYIPIKRPPVPAVKTAGWIRNPIDAFILHDLEAKGFEPSREAPKSALLRRLSLDLIGLPPTPRELHEFLADGSPQAYERQVDRLLASPHFGERMAVPWLDVVRFADTVGYHGDQNQDVFPYRDYVINAFNQNKPFDQFTVEQLAGDLLPNPTTEQRVATCFNRLNMVTREGGAQPKEYLAKYAADRVRTISMAWLGSTMGCAECHDHKYDPFTSKDFYQMEAFFADIKQWGVYMDYDYTPNPDLRGFSNDHPFPPEIQVDNPYLHQRLSRLQTRADDLYADSWRKLSKDKAELAKYQSWRQASLSFLREWSSGWAMPIPQLTLRMKSDKAVAETNSTVQPGGWFTLSAEPRENVKVALPLTGMRISAIRLEIVTRPDFSEKESTASKRRGTSVTLSAVLKRLGEEKESKLPFYHGEADYKEERYSNGHAIIGVTDHWEVSKEQERQTAVWVLDKPVEAKPGDILILNLGNPDVASARVSVTPFAAPDPLKSGVGIPLSRALSKSVFAPDRDERELLAQTYLLSSRWNEQLFDKARKLKDDIRECRGGKAPVTVTVAQPPYLMRVLRRGNWQDDGGDVVQPLPPHFLPQIPDADGRRLTRLDLAKWLVSRDNPLTARALMNRLWKQFFGIGISSVVDDLGAQGEWPVHPELLDWLASEFMQPETAQSTAGSMPPAFAWDLKHMVRLLVTSAAYRQDSNERPELKEIDPNNQLVAFQSPRRLEAEFIRDNALAISGLLDPDIGGPSAFPYQPPGYYTYLQFPDRDYHPNQDERQYRRGVYTHWQRTFLHPMLANFDAPSREECTANRVVSDTPQQALTLLNDPTFVEASRVFAKTLVGLSVQTDVQRLDQAFVRALDRSARANERRALLAFLQLQREHYHQHPEEAEKLLRVGLAPGIADTDRTEAAAWTQVCRVLLNLHETITIY